METHGHSNAIENILKDIFQFSVRKKHTIKWYVLAHFPTIIFFNVNKVSVGKGVTFLLPFPYVLVGSRRNSEAHSSSQGSDRHNCC